MEELLNALVKWGEPLTWELVYVEIDQWRRIQAEASPAFFGPDHARSMQEQARAAHRRAIERIHELESIQRQLRQHAPALLHLVPIVDFFNDAQDCKAWAQAMRKIEGDVRKELTTVVGSPAAKTANEPRKGKGKSKSPRPGTTGAQILKLLKKNITDNQVIADRIGIAECTPGYVSTIKKRFEHLWRSKTDKR
jgi:hypothetical protein